MAFIHQNVDAVLAGLLAGGALLLILLLVTLAWLGKLNRLYRRLTRGTSGGNLEEVLHGHMGSVAEMGRRLGATEAETARLSTVQPRCLQHVGLVRFDAFEDVGGEQSFAVAVLDDTKSGMVISSVFSRTDVRVYAKSISQGKPSHSLTAEEQRAIRMAEGS